MATIPAPMLNSKVNVDSKNLGTRIRVRRAVDRLIVALANVRVGFMA
jgi:hypothetical protein